LTTEPFLDKPRFYGKDPDFKCGHPPHIVRRTFQVADRVTVYDLCSFCKSIPYFQEYLIKEENLQELKN